MGVDLTVLAIVLGWVALCIFLMEVMHAREVGHTWSESIGHGIVVAGAFGAFLGFISIPYILIVLLLG